MELLLVNVKEEEYPILHPYIKQEISAKSSKTWASGKYAM